LRCLLWVVTQQCGSLHGLHMLLDISSEDRPKKKPLSTLECKRQSVLCVLHALCGGAPHLARLDGSCTYFAGSSPFTCQAPQISTSLPRSAMVGAQLSSHLRRFVAGTLHGRPFQFRPASITGLARPLSTASGNRILRGGHRNNVLLPTGGLSTCSPHYIGKPNLVWKSTQ
jgi:hypothetical protein